MAIQNRRGTYGDFRLEKMVSGEMAVVLSGDPASASGRSVYICFEPGHVKRITTYEDFENELRAATEEIQEAFTDDIRSAISAAVTATAAANAAIEAANAATEAANTAAEAAGAYVLGDISDKTVTFAEASERANIGAGESTATLFGKIKKWLVDLKDAAFAAIANDLATTTAGSVLDARVGPVIADGFDNIQTQLTQLNGKIPARYAGSASAGGSATSAVKLDTAAAGSATQPVYFSGGKPVACTHTLAKSVPANAVFTDTNTYPYITTTTVPINRQFTAWEGSVAYAGGTPSKSGYKATRIGGYVNNDVILCTPLGWIRNLTPANTSTIPSVVWLWLMEPV